jgi:putative heme-binding domain-containing protein
VKRRGTRCWLISVAPALPLLLNAQAKPLSTATSAELAAGKRIFAAQCAWCHGTDGTGGAGPSLQRPTLRHARSDVDLVGIVRNGIPATEMPGFALSLTDAMSWRTAAYVRSLGRTMAQPLPGNARRGSAVYEARGCQACHVIAGRGGVLGPELTNIGTVRGPAHLRQAIIEPEAAHPAGYLVVRAVHPSGSEVRGHRLDEDAFWIHLRDSAGQVHVLGKQNLVRIDHEPRGTLMPSYTSQLSATELDDLVAYLASLTGER